VTFKVVGGFSFLTRSL